MAVDFLLHVGTKLDIQKTMKLRVVSFVGLFDKGKTFLINMLFNKQLPSSKVCVTQGLSCVYIEEKHLLIIDSPGIQATVSLREEDGVDRIVDAQYTEAFLFELISRISDNIIFVVNDFTWLEQKHVQQFYEKFKMQNKSSDIVVVHNFRRTRTAEDAHALFEK